MEDYQKRGYLLQDFRLFHLQEAQSNRIDYHYHEFCKLFFLLSGTGSYTVEGRRYLLKSGDVVRIGSHCLHRPEFEGSYERVILYISPAFLKAQSTPDCDLMDCFAGEEYVLRPTEQQAGRLAKLTQALERELSGSSYGREILGRGILLRLLVEISRGLQKHEGMQPSPVQPKDSRMRNLVAYLDAHFTEDLRIDDLAEDFFLSKYHMMRLFKAETGMSVHGYLSERRLLMARDLIAKGVAATDACFRSGFGSYSAFSRAYSKLFGASPTGGAKPDAVAEALLE